MPKDVSKEVAQQIVKAKFHQKNKGFLRYFKIA